MKRTVAVLLMILVVVCLFGGCNTIPQQNLYGSRETLGYHPSTQTEQSEPTEQNLATLSAYHTDVTSGNYEEILPDLNLAQINRIYNINGCLQSIRNIPDTSMTSGTLLYYNGDTNRNEIVNKSFGIQMFVAASSPVSEVYIRACWDGSWNPWSTMAESGSGDGKVIPNYANFSVFERFATIGDSLSVGTYRDANGQDVVDEGVAWGAHIAENCHNEWLSLGFGGATTTNWIEGVKWTKNNLQTALLPENECGAYIIALGYNDNNTTSSSGGVPLGSMEDIDPEDEDNNAVSYYGNMDKILRKLHGAFPDAKLFVLNNPYHNTDLAADYNVALSEITARLEGSNVYLIDMYGRYSNIYRELAADREGNHYHPQIYQYMGMLIVTAISDYMLDHVEEFRYIAN